MASLEYPNTSYKILSFYFKNESGRRHADFMDRSRMRTIVDQHIKKLGDEHLKLRNEIVSYCKKNNL